MVSLTFYWAEPVLHLLIEVPLVDAHASERVL